MFEVIRYRVQTWRRRGDVLIPAGEQEFREEGAALALGAAVRNGADGVAIYRVQGWPVQDLWREPKLIKQYGMIPEA
jgi:hypothetical protein